MIIIHFSLLSCFNLFLISLILPAPKNVPDLIFFTLNISKYKSFKFIAIAKDLSSIKADSELLLTNLSFIRLG